VPGGHHFGGDYARLAAELLVTVGAPLRQGESR
jgi:type IV secretory pathway VirJ component